MDHNDDEHAEVGTIRFSNSPRRWTTTTESLASPARSVHPEQDTGMMESISSQADFGHRTTDFFDDSSNDEGGGIGEAVTAPDDIRERPPSPSKRKRPPPGESFVSQCEPKRVTLPPDPDEPESEGYQRLESNLAQQVHAQTTDDATPDTSFNGSVDEIDLPKSRDVTAGLSYPKPARLSSGRTFRSSGAWGHEPSMDQRMSTYSDKALDQRLNVHGYAYEFMVRAMLNDEEIMRRGDSKRISGIRSSALPLQLRINDPRSPFPTGVERSSSTLSRNKKVQVVPPPIDTSAPRPSLPESYVRTPYPFDRIARKDFGKEPPSAVESPMGASESVLTLSIRRANPHSLPKVTSITIPASNDFSAVGTVHGKEQKQHFKALVFDDAEFFRQLRQGYVDLAGSKRFFSARSLARIAVSGPATRAADAGYGWLHQPRSPRVLAYKGLTDTFSEERILQHYRKPALGKSRYAFVHWAHRLAAAPPARSPAFPRDYENLDTPNAELVRRMEQSEGLEYIVSWSISRILLALTTIVLLSIAAVLLWIFLGKSTTPGFPNNEGFRDAGDRVGTGILIGIFVFLSGMGCFTAWLGVSWLTM